MTDALMEPPMADDKDKPKTLSVKLPIDVIEMARIVAACRNESMTDLLGNMMRPLLTEMQQEEFAKRTLTPKRKREPKS